jgi:anthranilate synthase/indole-3-glycerol phosphate synthase/phosphoribosylanthranilate isomerase
MGKTFGKVNVCIAGDFGSKGDKIKQWVEANGGTFSKELDHHVTHLISTQNAFRRSISISGRFPFLPWSLRITVQLTENTPFSPRGEAHERPESRVHRLA